jgi:hypothetical protein
MFLHLLFKQLNMLPTTSLRIVAALTCIAFSIAMPSALAQERSAHWLSVDMPHGGCSLTAHQDGSADIHFGAMPRWVRVAQHTFNFDELVKSLRGKSVSQRAPNAAGLAMGSLSLSDSTDLQFIDDHKLVRSLFERAWRARIRPTTRQEVEDYAWVSRACSLL